MKYYSCPNCRNNILKRVKPNIPETGEFIFCPNCKWLIHFNEFYDPSPFEETLQLYGIRFVSNPSPANAYDPQRTRKDYQKINLVKSILQQVKHQN